MTLFDNAGFIFYVMKKETIKIKCIIDDPIDFEDNREKQNEYLGKLLSRNKDATKYILSKTYLINK